MAENVTSASANVTIVDGDCLYNSGSNSVTKYRAVDLYVILVGLLGVVDNTFVAVVIMHFTKMRNRISGMLILNQTLVDLAASALLVIIYTVYYTHGYHPEPGWTKTWSEIYCRLFLTEWLQYGMMLSSTTNLVLLNLERYLGIVHPLFHKCSVTKKNFAVPGIVIVWVSGPIYCLLWAIPSTYMEDGSCMLYNFHDIVQWSTTNGLSWVFFNYFGPLACMVYFYIRMVFVLSQSKKNTGVPNNNTSTAQKNLIKTLMFITLAFVACMTWDNVNWLIFTMDPDYGNSYNCGNEFYYSFLLSSFNACVNPFIYIANCSAFQQGARSCVLCKSKMGAMEENEQSSRESVTDVV